MKRITAFAPAKINLGLRITGRYENGYHHLETVFAPISIYDRITIEPAGSDAVRHSWPTGTALIQKSILEQGLIKNPLMLKILEFVRSQLKVTAGIALPPLHIAIAKQIPSPSGLGGASADAAALIDALYRLYAPGANPVFASPAFLTSIAALGADIPFFLRHGLSGRAARLTGIGHELSPVQIPDLAGFVVIPPFGFSTAKMFAHVRTLALPVVQQKPVAPEPNLTLRLNEIPFSDELAGRVKIVQNDFDAVAQAVFPAESRLLAEAKQQVALTVGQFWQGESSWLLGMTGSGAGLFTATDARLPQATLAKIAPVLKARLGASWRVLPFRSLDKKIGP